MSKFGVGPRLLWPVVLLVVGTYVTGCDTFPSIYRIAVSQTDDGAIQIRYVACGSQQVHAVRLTQAHEDPADAVVLWEIRSAEGSAVRTFTVGEAPAGFEEQVEFPARRVDENEVLLATVETGEQTGSGISFKLSDLERGKVFARTGQGRSENVDTQTFEQRAEASCRR